MGLRNGCCIGLSVVLGSIAGMHAWAQAPELINYQGRLVDGSGPINGSRTVVVRLYDGMISTNLLYTETQNVTAVDGLFNLDLGASNAVPGSLTAALDQNEAWLELEVDGVTMTPRERIKSVPYAIYAGNAQTLEGLSAADFAETNHTHAGSGGGGITSIALNGNQLEIVDGIGTSLVDLASLETDKGGSNMADIATLSNQVAAVKRIEAGSVSIQQLGDAGFSVPFVPPYATAPVVTLTPTLPDVEPYLESSSTTGFTGVAQANQAGLTTTSLQLESPQVGSQPSGALVQGNPAFAYRVGTSSALTFRRALDADGTEWGNPIEVDPSSSAYMDLAEVAGRPAIAYSAGSEVRFVRALDATGTTWGMPVVITNSASLSTRIEMEIVDGNPAVVFVNTSSDELYYARAVDSDGSSWDPPLLIEAAETGSSIAVVNGNPAICYVAYTNFIYELHYVRASNTTGTAWSPSVSLGSSNFDAKSSLSVVDGRPAVGFSLTSTELGFAHATDMEGTNWAAAITLDASASLSSSKTISLNPDVNGRAAILYVGSSSLRFIRSNLADASSWDAPASIPNSASQAYVSLLIANGRPAVVAGQSSSILYARADDVNGATWGDPLELNYSPGLSPSMALVDGRPAIAHLDGSSGSLLYNAANDPEGASWSAAIPIETGSDPSLAALNGRPAVAFRLGGGVSNELRFVVSDTAAGTNWPASVLVTTNTTSVIELTVIDGKPVIAYLNQSDGHLNYVAATDTNGSSWAAPVVVEPSVCSELSLHEVGGRPALAYRLDFGSNDRLKYTIASDPSGTSWSSPIQLDSRISSPILRLLEGRPAVAYYYATSSRREIRLVRATDSIGTAWGAPETVVDDAQRPLFEVIDGVPVISYTPTTTGGLTYAVGRDAEGSAFDSTVWRSDSSSSIDILNVGERPAAAISINGLRYYRSVPNAFSVNWIAVEP